MTFEVFLTSLIILLVASLGFLFPRSKCVFYFELIALICFVGGYNGNVDMVSYRLRFEAEALSGTFAESLFYAVSALIHKLGFSFEAYHLILTALSFSLIAYVMYQLSEKPAMTISLMWGYATLEYACQIQGLCAAAVVVYTLYYYFTRIYRGHPRRRHYAAFIALLLICVSVHFYTAFFVMFLTLKRLDKATLCFWDFGWFIVVSAFLNFLFAHAQQFISGTDSYSPTAIGAKTFLCLCSWLIFGVWCAGYNSRVLKKRRYGRNVSAFSDFVEKGSLLMLMILPFFRITSVFERIFRIWMPFLYIELSFFRSGKFKQYFSESILLTYNIGTFVLFYIIFIHNGYSIYMEIARHNLFW